MEGLITLGKDVLSRFEKSGVVYKLICKRGKVTVPTQYFMHLSHTLQSQHVTCNKMLLVITCSSP